MTFNTYFPLDASVTWSDPVVLPFDPKNIYTAKPFPVLHSASSVSSSSYSSASTASTSVSFTFDNDNSSMKSGSKDSISVSSIASDGLDSDEATKGSNSFPSPVSAIEDTPPVTSTKAPISLRAQNFIRKLIRRNPNVPSPELTPQQKAYVKYINEVLDKPLNIPLRKEVRRPADTFIPQWPERTSNRSISLSASTESSSSLTADHPSPLGQQLPDPLRVPCTATRVLLHGPPLRSRFTHPAPVYEPYIADDGEITPHSTPQQPAPCTPRIIDCVYEEIIYPAPFDALIKLQDLGRLNPTNFYNELEYKLIGIRLDHEGEGASIVTPPNSPLAFNETWEAHIEGSDINIEVLNEQLDVVRAERSLWSAVYRSLGDLKTWKWGLYSDRFFTALFIFDFLAWWFFGKMIFLTYPSGAEELLSLYVSGLPFTD